MLNWFKSKKELINEITNQKIQIDKLKKEIEFPDEWSCIYSRRENVLLKEQEQQLRKQLQESKNTIQEKDQRIIGLQKILLDLQREKLEVNNEC